MLCQELQGDLKSEKLILKSVTRALSLESDKSQLDNCKDSLFKYLQTDTLLHRPDGSEYDDHWEPVVKNYCAMTGEHLVTARNLFQRQEQDVFTNSRNFIQDFDAWKTVALELSTKSLKSFILWLLWIQGKIKDEQVIDLALLETTMQVKKWGIIEDEHTLERKRLLLTQRLATLLLVNNIQ